MTLTHPVKYLCIFLCLWLASCTEVQNTPKDQQAVTSDGTVAGAYAPASQLAAFSSTTSGVIVQDLATRQAKFRLSHQDPVQNLVTQLVFSHDGKYLLTADRKQVALWQMSDGKNLGFWSVPGDATVRDMAVSDYGRHLVIAQNDGKIQHINLKSGRRLEFLGHQQDPAAIDHNVNSVAISPNGRYVLSGGNDYKSYFWDSDSGQILLTITHPSRVTKVALDPQARYLFSADSQKQALIYDLKTGKKVSQLQLGRVQQFSAARFSDDGQRLLTGSPGRLAERWQVSTGQKISSWRVQPSASSRLQQALVYDIGEPNPAEAITVSSSGLVELWRH